MPGLYACGRALLCEPVRDYIAALDAIRDRGYGGLAVAGVTFALAWFAYVPIHELFHAWGCMLAGGDVTRLEIAPEYGGALLARVVPFVASGSQYAGQLTGFDTHGNDAIYLATVLSPFLLTIVAGVPLLKRLARPLAHPACRSHAGGNPCPMFRKRHWIPAFAGTTSNSSFPRAGPPLLGAVLPFAYAPFVSVPGDYYEAGSIVVSRLAHALDPALPLARWRSDDVLKLARELADSGASAGDWLGVAASLALGILLALLTYHAGGWAESLRRMRGSG